MTDIVERIRALLGDTNEEQDTINEAADEIERLRAALRPFAADKLPSDRWTETAYDWDGLRSLMSPLEIAMLNARRTLLPLQPTPNPPCKNCDGEPNCYCARAALSPAPSEGGDDE